MAKQARNAVRVPKSGRESRHQANDNFKYTIYSDASFFPGHDHCGWAYVLLCNNEIIAEGSGKLATRSIHIAELFAMLQGLWARPDKSSCLLLCDIIVGTARFPDECQDNLTIRRLTAKGRDAWHMRCHDEARLKANCSGPNRAVRWMPND